ncbi:MAG: uroporphyrinogen decarboxylase family protein [Terracidiphilus sp.]|nr:uroporphyrinogen decarboxylase family protein [Terracidiphilus sp.]
MKSKQRLLAALTGQGPDRLPVTTHHIMPYYLEHSLGGMEEQQFFDHFGIDPITWAVPHRPAPGSSDYPDPEQGALGFLESHRVWSDNWRVYSEDVSKDGRKLTRFNFVTPGGTLTMLLETAAYTSWVLEPVIKEKRDIDLLGKYMTTPSCDVEALNRIADAYGDRGFVRGHICCFDVFGQPGCWQDATCLVGTERLILEASDDPDWVHELLAILQRRKLGFIRSLSGARYDLLELGGGDASASVISPRFFDRFVAPYDKPLVEAAHEAGQRIVYHLCGKIMPMLSRTVDLGVDAIETFSPAGMGGDARLAEAHKIVDGRCCMIGGFDQLHFFTGCDEAATRAEVRRCFREAGEGGRYILAPSDHFFDAQPELLRAFADEAAQCTY